MKEIKTYFECIRLNLLSGLQYRGWPLMIIQVLTVVITDPIGTIFLFSRFGSIGAWSMERILLIYAIAVTGFGLAETFCRGFDYFPFHMVQNGEFDRVLLRPRSLSFQVASARFHIHRLARVAAGLCLIGWALWKQGIMMGPEKIAMLVLALVGGFITYAGVFVFTSGIAFFTIQGVDWIFIFTNASYQVTRCPVEYLPRVLKNTFTFFMPMLLVSYYPASVICGWGEPSWKGWLALPAGLLFLAASNFVWRFGVRHYKSTGS